MSNSVFSIKSLLVFCLFLVTFNILLYLPAMKGDFVFDDIQLVKNSPITQNPDFLKDFVGQAFGDPLSRDANSRDLEKGMQYYRPLVALSFWLDYKLWGLNAAGFHLTNILLHTLNVLLLFLLVARCLNDWLAALASACLFSVFPTHFENVAWISGRTDVLGLLFLLLSAHFFLSAVRSGSKRSTLLSALLFFLALLAKETVVLALLVYAYVFIVYGKKGTNHARTYFAMTFAFAVVSFWLLRSRAVSMPHVNLANLPLGALFSGIGFYLSRGLFPFRLGFSIAEEKILFAPAYFILGIAVCLFFSAAVIYYSLKKKLPPIHLPLAALVFLLLLPSLSILFFENPVSLLAWRFLYMPLAAAIPLLALISARALRPLSFGLLAAALVLLFGIELVPRVRYYGQSERNFWLKLPHPERESRLFRLNHAANLFAVDEKKAAALLEPFIADHHSFLADFFRRRALEIGAFHFTAINGLEKARTYFSLLFGQYKEQPLNVFFQYAVFLAKSGKPEKGREIVSHYLSVFPENHEVLLHAADFFARAGDNARTLSILKKDYRIFPTASTLAWINKITTRSRPGPDG